MENTNPEQRDEKLWKMARKRAAFKRHLFSYILVNAFLWVIWFFSGHYWNEFDDMGPGMHHYGYHFPWPLIVMFFWGIGLAFDFFHSYYSYKDNMIEKEYQKLLNKKV
jgi:hypothetical protein